MLYLICPERSMWFLAEAENREELYAKNKNMAYIRKQRKGAVVINLSDETDGESHVEFFIDGTLTEQERSAFFDSIRTGEYYNHPLPANLIVGLYILLTDDDDDDDEHDEEG